MCNEGPYQKEYVPNASHNFNYCEVIEVLQNTLMLLIILVLALALSFVIKDTVGQIASVSPPLLDLVIKNGVTQRKDSPKTISS